MNRRIKINEQVRANEIRVIGHDGQQHGVMSPQDGLKLARESSMDLVEIAPLSKPPVCRIMDYSKYKYDQEKKERDARKRQHVIRMKEVRYKPRIDEHDYQTKLGQLKNFIKKGNKVKVSLRFRGRELAHTELGREVLNRIVQDTVDVSEVEKPPLKEGRFLNMVLTPK